MLPCTTHKETLVYKHRIPHVNAGSGGKSCLVACSKQWCRGVLTRTHRSKYTFQIQCTTFIAVVINKPPPKQYTRKQVKLETRCRLETRAEARVKAKVGNETL